MNHQKTTEKKNKKKTPHETRTTKKGAGLHPGTPSKTVVFLLMAQQSGEKTSWETGIWLKSHHFQYDFVCTMPGVDIAGFLKHPTVGRVFFWGFGGGNTQQSRPKIHAIESSTDLGETNDDCDQPGGVVPKQLWVHKVSWHILKPPCRRPRRLRWSLHVVKLYRCVSRITVNLGEEKKGQPRMEGWFFFLAEKSGRSRRLFFW